MGSLKKHSQTPRHVVWPVKLSCNLEVNSTFLGARVRTHPLGTSAGVSVKTDRASAPPADILVYINDSCVLGRSHKEVVDMLKSVPMGQSVDVVLRRGYPMLYNPDGCPKQSLEPVGVIEEYSLACLHVIL